MFSATKISGQLKTFFDLTKIMVMGIYVDKVYFKLLHSLQIKTLKHFHKHGQRTVFMF